MSSRTEQIDSIVNWYTANGSNSYSEALDQATGPNETAYTMAQEMAEEGWEIPGMSVEEAATEGYVSGFEGVRDDAVDHIRERAENER